MDEVGSSFWGREPSSPSSGGDPVRLPYQQWGTTGVIIRPLGIPTAGTPFGRIRIDHDAVTVRGFLWRTYTFPRTAATRISSAKGLFAKGIRLHSDALVHDVIFFPHEGVASLNRALALAGFSPDHH